MLNLISTKLCTKRLKILWPYLASVAAIGLIGFWGLLWSASPQDLSVGRRMLTSGVMSSWRNGDLIVLIRHEERCDHSEKTCLGPADGLTIAGAITAMSVGEAFHVLGISNSDILSSPAMRTVQTSLFMFGKASLLSDPSSICGKTMSAELLAHKERGRNLLLVTHSGCISEIERDLGCPRATHAEYGSALFVKVSADGRLEVLGALNTKDWAAALKQL